MPEIERPITVRMRSLFVLSLPRSLSSRVYHAARQALGLAQPVWTTDGELLNVDRHVLYRGDRRDQNLKFLRPHHAPAIADRITAFLDQCAAREGFAYKDVVQPFVCAAWRGLSEFRVLRIRRPLADIALSIQEQGWVYPAHAVRRVSPRPDDALRGLLLAERALSRVPARVVEYDELIRREGALGDALAELYPGHPIHTPPWLDAASIAVRDRLLARRRTPAFHAVQARLDALAAELPAD